MRIVRILLETVVQLMTHLILVLFTMKPTQFCCLASSPLSQRPCPSSVVFLRQSNDAYVSSFNFLHWFKERTFHVPILTFSFGCLVCVICHLVLWTVALLFCLMTVALKRAIFAVCSLHFCGRLIEIQNYGADLLSIRINNFSWTSRCRVRVKDLQSAAGILWSQLLSSRFQHQYQMKSQIF